MTSAGPGSSPPSTASARSTSGGLFGNSTYGPPERRDPPRTATVFRVNPAVPGALEAVKGSFTTQPAREFSFDRYLHQSKPSSAK